MKKGMMWVLMVVLSLTVTFSSGCAKKATVKSDSQISEEQAAEQKLREERAAKEAAEQKLREEQAAKEKAAQLATKEDALKEQSMKEQAAKDAAISETSEKSVLTDIHFDYDKYSIQAEDREILKRNADWMLKNSDQNVIVEGHCDERGTTEYNLALGERRAAEAMKYLVELGVGKNRLKKVSYGEEKPLDSGHTEDAWAKNRRAHFGVVPANK